VLSRVLDDVEEKIPFEVKTATEAIVEVRASTRTIVEDVE
jgi:hypothetical protein